MIVIENFGLYSKEQQEKLFETVSDNKKKYVSYYSCPIHEEVDDDTIDQIYEGLIHFFDPCIKDLVNACVSHQIFLYCYNNNIVTPVNIMVDVKKNMDLLKNGKFKLLDNPLKKEIKKAVSLCLQVNIDYNEYEKLKCRSIEINRKVYFNGMFHDSESEVMWYRFTNVHELVSELYKYGRFEFLLIDHCVDDYLIGFEVYENAESFDLKIYHCNEEAFRQSIKKLGFDLK